jgi:hypothetical protein
MTVAEYLRRINPVYRQRNGRWVVGSESRQRTFKAVEEVLLAGGGVADFPTAVALTLPRVMGRRSRLFGATCAVIASRPTNKLSN